MLQQTQLNQIREELDYCNRPIYFFDDDIDGLSSFLLLYRYKQEGKGVILKTMPKLEKKFVSKIKGYDADKIFLLDCPMIDPEFVENVKVPIIWIDHHEPQKDLPTKGRLKYFNPRLQNINDNIPTSQICYEAVKQEEDEDLWIAMMGVVGDWQLPDFTDEFRKKYPDLLAEKIKNPEQALFESELGKLIRIVNFSLKGKTTEAMKCVKILTRIKSPYEILRQETSAGAFIYKRFLKVNKEYHELLNKAKTAAEKSKKEKKKIDKILFFKYHEKRMSFTKELSNELLYLFPEKITIIGREKSGEVKCSLRSGPDIELNKILAKALVGINGYGGGHEHACGACIKVRDFERFMGNLRINLG